MPKNPEAKEASEEVYLINRDHGKSEAYPGPWKIGAGGHHLYFWPQTDLGVEAAEAQGFVVDVVLLRAGPDLTPDEAEAVIRRASASPDMEAVLLDFLKLIAIYPVIDFRTGPVGALLESIRAALTKSGAL